MRVRTKSNTLVMIQPMATYIAGLMPSHVKGQKHNGSTTMYFKHSSGTMMAEFDYKTVSLLGKVMTRKEMVELFTQFVSECKGFGKKGGKRADVTANRAFSCLLKEGLIVRV